MIFQSKKAAGIISVFGLAAILVAGIFGLSHVGAGMGAVGAMNDCPFAFGISVCGMSPFQHLSVLENSLTILPQKEFLSLASFLVLIFFAFLFIWFLKINSPRLLLARSGVWALTRPSSYNYLLEAFSNGILNPKLF